MPAGHNNPKQQVYTLARAHHETVDRHFKCFGCLSNTYRHPLHQHGTMVPLFHAVANITLLTIMDNEPLFQGDYDESCNSHPGNKLHFLVVSNTTL